MAECFAAFGPDKDMQLYGRGIRRRLAPMLDGDQQRLRLAYSLQFSLPGTPVLRYGEEIGMGDDLSLPDRESLRTPMQWADAPNAGFSTTSGDLVHPVIADGSYGYPRLNVSAQQRDPDSLLRWFEHMVHTLRECPEVGSGTCTVVAVDEPAVLAHRMDAGQGTLLFLHNLGRDDVRVDVGRQPGQDAAPVEVLADRGYPPPGENLTGLDLAGCGYRWIRLRRSR
jgi:maltose alpha-D-glucosyltransferase/alpha-amylase